MEDELIKKKLERNFSFAGIENYNKRFNYSASKKPIFYTDIYSIKGLEFGSSVY